MYRQWLEKAEHDLKSAKILYASNEAVLDTAIYHTQQCAEKALKAFLVLNKIEFEKIHDVRLLLEKCTSVDSSFQQYVDAAITLTPYATIFRYPDEMILPEKEDVLEAINLAEAIYHFVASKTGNTE